MPDMDPAVLREGRCAMMNQAEQTAFIKNGFETLYRELKREDSALLQIYDVPEDEGGWCKWKLIPSPVTAADLDGLEQEAGCKFPSLLRAFFPPAAIILRRLAWDARLWTNPLPVSATPGTPP